MRLNPLVRTSRVFPAHHARDRLPGQPGITVDQPRGDQGLELGTRGRQRRNPLVHVGDELDARGRGIHRDGQGRRGAAGHVGSRYGVAGRGGHGRGGSADDTRVVVQAQARRKGRAHTVCGHRSAGAGGAVRQDRRPHGVDRRAGMYARPAGAASFTVMLRVSRGAAGRVGSRYRVAGRGGHGGGGSR